MNLVSLKSFVKFWQRVPLINFLVQSESVNSELRNLASIKSRNITLSRGAQTYFDVLNRLGVNHQCDRRMDEQRYDTNSVPLNE